VPARRCLLITRRDFYQGTPYQGTSPYKVASNATIIYGIIAFAITGLCVHIYLYQRHKREYMRKAQERNLEAAEALRAANSRAKDGYKLQLQRLNDSVCPPAAGSGRPAAAE